MAIVSIYQRHMYISDVALYPDVREEEGINLLPSNTCMGTRLISDGIYSQLFSSSVCKRPHIQS